jgi:hypothetical protein
MELQSSLQNIDFSLSQKMEPSGVTFCPSECLEIAKKHLTEPQAGAKQYRLILPESAEALRWFVLPQEVSATIDAKKLAS